MSASALRGGGIIANNSKKTVIKTTPKPKLCPNKYMDASSDIGLELLIHIKS